jgi:hypothetical protein
VNENLIPLMCFVTRRPATKALTAAFPLMDETLAHDDHSFQASHLQVTSRYCTHRVKTILNHFFIASCFPILLSTNVFIFSISAFIAEHKFEAPQYLSSRPHAIVMMSTLLNGQSEPNSRHFNGILN